MSKGKNTIQEIVQAGLCTGCGTCAGICPTSAINMVIDSQKTIYIPELNASDCNQCGICLDACPGHSTDHQSLNLNIFGKLPDNIFMGNYIRCYLSHSTDYNVRYNSASGGLVTSLLIFALEQGLIDGALVTRMKKDNPMEPEPFIARTKEEIIQASSSKYCPVPAGIAIREILKKDGKYAVVGLPCHINGIRKAEAANKVLRERITMHLGIFCSHTDSIKGTEFLLRELGIKCKDMAAISYRGKGWPGRILINSRNGNEHEIKLGSPLFIVFHSSFVFSPNICLSCDDITNELADISFGDPWLKEIKIKEHSGKSILITRSEQGQALLQAANAKGVIELSALDIEDVLRSQRMALHFKKINVSSRRKLLKHGSLKSNEYPEITGGFCNIFIAALALIHSHLGYSRIARFILSIIPVNLLRLYIEAFFKFYSLIIKRDFNRLEQSNNKENS